MSAQSDRKWLLAELKKVKDYGLPVLIIDYLPANKREQANQLAKKIQNDGFIPWITNGDLTQMGVGGIKVIPRKILILYDSNAADLIESDAFRLLAMPLEYDGYLPRFVDVRTVLPKNIKGEYQGIIAWLGNNSSGYREYLARWLSRQVKKKYSCCAVLTKLFLNLARHY